MNLAARERLQRTRLAGADAAIAECKRWFPDPPSADEVRAAAVHLHREDLLPDDQDELPLGMAA